MNEEMFAIRGLDPLVWTRHVRGLYRSGVCLVMPAQKELGILKEMGQGTSEHYVEAQEAFAAYCRTSGLLFGLAIENAYKTRKIIEGQITVENGAMIGLKTGHDIAEMVREHGIVLDAEEVLAVDSITCVVQDLGKYPVAKSAKVQGKFNNTFYGPEYVRRLSARIIVQMLKEDPYVKIFAKERLADVMDSQS